MLREDNALNKMFLMYLFSDQVIALGFLKDVGLIRSKVQCNICDREVTWFAKPNLPEGFHWRCQRRVAGARCRGSASIRHGSRFQKSNLTLQEILLITYNIVCCKPPLKIHLAHYMFVARCKALCLSYNSTISSRTPNGRCAKLVPPLPRDALALVPAIHRNLRRQVRRCRILTIFRLRF